MTHPSCPPSRCTNLFVRSRARVKNPGSSPSKSKFGTHRVIDFGQLPFPYFLSLPAALRPAAVCEPTYRATKQLATCPSTLWGLELSCYFHTASPYRHNRFGLGTLGHLTSSSPAARGGGCACVCVSASRAARGQARCVSISCTPSRRQSPGLVTEKVASPLITPECPCGFARSYRRHGLYSSNLDIFWKWHTGLLNLSYLDHLRPSFAVGNTARPVPLHHAAHTPTWPLSSSPRSSKMASGLRGPRTSTTS